MTRLIVPINEKDHCQGSVDAPVTLVEYGDYQCQTCRLAFSIVKQFINEMGGKLRFVFRHFPLKQTHPQAFEDAQAAEAAGRQNKFWEMHELLYGNPLRKDPKTVRELAEELGLNHELFEADMQSQSIVDKIQDDFMEGVRSGVNATPCFFINGERYDGDPSYHTFLEALRQAVKH
jgi:protein-disulfide isomerase